MDAIIFTVFPTLIVIGVVNNLIYLKKLKELLAYLQSNHSDKLLELNLPTGFMNSSPGGSLNTVKFLKSSEYFNDDKVKELKDKALVYFRLGYVIFGTFFVGFALLFVIDFISKK